jgi:hypothetical protein
MLSYHLAKEELEEELLKVATATHTKDIDNFKIAFEKLTGFGVQTSDVAPKSTLAQLRPLTVTLPYTRSLSQSHVQYWHLQLEARGTIAVAISLRMLLRPCSR